MISLIAIGIFVIVVGSTWFLGFWSGILNLVNFFLAALVASSFYENVAVAIENADSTYTYLADFVALWALFVGTYALLRTVTDILSPVRLRFHPVVEYAGRSVTSLWLALAFISFTFFSLHMAPLPPDVFQATPGERALGIGPDRFWLAFVQSRSRGALANYRESSIFNDYNLPNHPDDLKLEARVFDPMGNFIFEQAARRKRLSKSETLRVAN